MKQNGVVTAVREQLDSTRLRGDAWSQEQWWEAFNFLFMDEAGGADNLHHNDDLLFFVHAVPQSQRRDEGPMAGPPQRMGTATAGATAAAAGLDAGPFSVRRRGRQLSSEWQLSGSHFKGIAWKDTLLLNLALQSHFVLTVVVCRWALGRHLSSAAYRTHYPTC